MGKFFIGLAVGIIAGGLAAFFLFVGVPRAAQSPGVPIRPPDVDEAPGTAQIVLKEAFFNEVLSVIFRDMKPPAFPLMADGPVSNEAAPVYAAFQAEQPCDGTIRLLAEGSGVKTGARFDENRITAPMAFAGSFDSPFGCLRFTGWAQTGLDLTFDAQQQTVFGRVNVETVNLDGANPILSGFVTPLVQTTLNNRVNPVRVLQGEQIALNLPIASAGGVIKATVTDVRADISDKALNLYVVYDLSGAAL